MPNTRWGWCGDDGAARMSARVGVWLHGESGEGDEGREGCQSPTEDEIKKKLTKELVARTTCARMRRPIRLSEANKERRERRRCLQSTADFRLVIPFLPHCDITMAQSCKQSQMVRAQLKHIYKPAPPPSFPSGTVPCYIHYLQ
jgi:hypothetical protein